ncbi:restriction endonuclease [Lysobacter psychrotolerans]|uniref:Restriction endonuclease n=2 Tax=Montanilutibacter psychrotolerans TaxID=1327343 RepID=A0A3M8SYC1_9GAMM|nr:restriction endonuclease [Lysobacter psychrotolerans]
MQYGGKDRYLTALRGSLNSGDFTTMRLAAAYAKTSGVARIFDDVSALRKRGGNAGLIVGIDQKGTSYQALSLAMQAFNEVHVSHTGGGGTFHPKFCLLAGPVKAQLIVGSHNLTCGGLETNLEAGVVLTYELPLENVEFQEADAMWTNLLAASFTKQLSPASLNTLLLAGSLFDESAKGAKRSNVGSSAQGAGGALIFPRVKLTPPSAIPKGVLAAAAPLPPGYPPAGPFMPPAPVVPGAVPLPLGPVVPGVPVAPPLAAPTVAGAAALALVIQLRPHDNGEIFLSMSAVKQNPAFFDFPFTGNTTPKKLGGVAYPQRVPDPVVDVTVYSSTGAKLVTQLAYALNTVYYKPKSELRVTMTSAIRDHISNLSILHMQIGSGGVDYIMDVYNPGSADYAMLLASCNQTMPGGGSAPRLFGWV